MSAGIEFQVCLLASKLSIFSCDAKLLEMFCNLSGVLQSSFRRDLPHFVAMVLY